MLFFTSDLFRPGYFVIILGAILIGCTQIWAAPASKNGRQKINNQVQVYGAKEPGSDVGSPAPLESVPMLENLSLKNQTLLANSTVLKSASNSEVGHDEVPITKRDAILDRLSLVEKLIRKFGRAYDYRSITTKELETIFQRLEKKQLQETSVATADNKNTQPTTTQAVPESHPVSVPVNQEVKRDSLEDDLDKEI